MSAFQEIDSDLEENVLLHTPIPWTDTIRQAEELASADTETLGIRSFDLMHVGLALALETFLADRPETGNVIKGSGGMRKLRWAGGGRGKRGGLLVISYWWVAKDPI